MSLKPLRTKERLQKLKQDPKEIAYFCARNKTMWPQMESFILTDKYACYFYARYVLNKRWPEAESFIMTDGFWASCYSEAVLNERWLEAETTIRNSRAWSNYKQFWNIIE